MIVLASMHDEKYQELANETWDNNKVPYAEKHGYAYLAKTEDFYGFDPGFEKIAFLIDILDNYPDTTWIWWTGSDGLVMNFNTRVEDKVAEAPDAHVIMSADFNFAINADSMLVKNTPEARAWLQDCMDNIETYGKKTYKEQQFMLDTMDKYAGIVKLMPQNFMNSYEYRMYKVMPWLYEKTTDINGDRGQWETGDWFVQWPGTQPRERLELVKEYKPKIIL